MTFLKHFLGISVEENNFSEFLHVWEKHNCILLVNGFTPVLHLEKGVRKFHIPKIPKKTAVGR